ncbi:MAG TPA: hypothetical protein VFP12_17040 [Allosphingosinicella sp.]|nr:hypothetical protein [Allosphingosinicella sp.]
MKTLAVTLAAFVFAAPALAAADDLAPAVKRRPAATATPPAAPQQIVTASPAPAAPHQVATASPAPAAPQQGAKTLPAPAVPQPAVRSERDSYLALTAGTDQGGSDAAIDTSLIRVMSRLVASGRCGEAATLAARDGRKELASRAQQLCK